MLLQISARHQSLRTAASRRSRCGSNAFELDRPTIAYITAKWQCLIYLFIAFIFII